MSLQNTRVLVIGGTSGIGLGVAVAAAASGATVDLTNAADLDRLAEEVGAIDHLVYTAGEPFVTVPLAELTPELITGFLQTRFVGALSAVRVFALRERGGDTWVWRASGQLVRCDECADHPLWNTMADADVQALYDNAAQQLPVGRIGEAADAALSYVYCMEQGYGTGAVIKVDGGGVLI